MSRSKFCATVKLVTEEEEHTFNRKLAEEYVSL